MGYYNFPHTRNYVSDLGFLIKKYYELGKDYDTLVAIYEKIKKYIASIDDKIIEYTEKFTLEQLQKWLDDGTLENLISQIGHIIRVYNTTIELLEDTTITSGLIVKTLGYESVNDGGDGLFIIKDSSEKFNFKTVNNLFAELIQNENMNAMCFGITENFSDCIDIQFECNNLIFNQGDYNLYNLQLKNINIDFNNSNIKVTYNNNAHENIFNCNENVSIKNVTLNGDVIELQTGNETFKPIINGNDGNLILDNVNFNNICQSNVPSQGGVFTDRLANLLYSIDCDVYITSCNFFNNKNFELMNIVSINKMVNLYINNSIFNNNTQSINFYGKYFYMNNIEVNSEYSGSFINCFSQKINANNSKYNGNGSFIDSCEDGLFNPYYSSYIDITGQIIDSSQNSSFDKCDDIIISFAYKTDVNFVFSSREKVSNFDIQIIKSNLTRFTTFSHYTDNFNVKCSLEFSTYNQTTFTLGNICNGYIYMNNCNFTNIDRMSLSGNLLEYHCDNCIFNNFAIANVIIFISNCRSIESVKISKSYTNAMVSNCINITKNT